MAESAKTDQTEEEQTDVSVEESGVPLSASSDLTVKFRKHYTIDAADPLVELNSPNALAYAATDTRFSETQLFALICDPDLPVRVPLMMQMKINSPRHALPFIDWDIIEWPLTGRKTTVVIYERPLGGRLTDALASGATRISEYDVIERILTPAILTILDLEEAELTHRAIRPDNMFFMDTTYKDLVLGDCVTTPPGYDQPEIFETIERSTADPIGRGKGSSYDDIYALGVSIMFIMLRHNPVKHLSSQELLTEKIERNSYAALSANSRVPLPTIEFLRGMLNDEQEGRWTAESTETWIDGRKNAPVQRHNAPKAKTPYSFKGIAYNTSRTLAYAFSQDPEETFRTIKADENFEAWVRRNLDDREMADKIKDLTLTASRSGGNVQNSPEVVIAKLCILLDPSGPIRYKNLKFMIDSFGSYLAYIVLQKKSPQDIIEVVMRDLFDYWIKSQTSSSPDNSMWHRQILRSKGYLKIKEFGFGPERCLYELNKNLHCLSPLIVDSFCTEIEQLLPAMDNAASNAEPDSRPIDRHIAGFIGARFNEDIHPHLRAMALPEPERAIIGTLSLLAFIQWKLKTSPVYGLSSWLGGLLGPAIATYHNNKTRKGLEKEIPQLVRKGSLPELFDLVDNAEQRAEDETGFSDALKKYSEAEEEIDMLEGKDGSKEENLLKSGQKVSAMAAILLSLIIVSVLFFIRQ